jgi:rare lipoprotein A
LGGRRRRGCWLAYYGCVKQKTGKAKKQKTKTARSHRIGGILQNNGAVGERKFATAGMLKSAGLDPLIDGWTVPCLVIRYNGGKAVSANMKVIFWNRPSLEWSLIIVAVLFLSAPFAQAKTDEQTKSGGNRFTQYGVASFYADKYHGKPTASGEIFDMYKLTAAHPSLPFGTMVKVTNLDNDRSVIVRINDRGPFIAGRAIDLSLAAAKELKMVEAGLARVKIETL